jgi:hypothetical protein
LRPETLKTLNKGKVKKNIKYTGGLEGIAYVDCAFASCSVRIAVQIVVTEAPTFKKRHHFLLWRNHDPVAEMDTEDAMAHFKIGSDASVLYTLRLWAPSGQAPFLSAKCLAPDQADLRPRWHSLDIDIDGVRVLQQGGLPSKSCREELRRAAYSQRSKNIEDRTKRTKCATPALRPVKRLKRTEAPQFETVSYSPVFSPLVPFPQEPPPMLHVQPFWVDQQYFRQQELLLLHHHQLINLAQMAHSQQALASEGPFVKREEDFVQDFIKQEEVSYVKHEEIPPLWIPHDDGGCARELMMETWELPPCDFSSTFCV